MNDKPRYYKSVTWWVIAIIGTVLFSTIGVWVSQSCVWPSFIISLICGAVWGHVIVKLGRRYF